MESRRDSLIQLSWPIVTQITIQEPSKKYHKEQYRILFFDSKKILDEQQVTVITTPTIMGSFLRKYSALSGLPEIIMRRLFNFRPILLGEPLMVHGGEFQFWYTIHTIPTIGFEAYYSGKSVYYSADTCYEPSRIRGIHTQILFALFALIGWDMLDKGVMKKGRANFFLEYNWHHNIVLHEAGVPPIHTPLSVLKELVKELKDRLYLVHILFSIAKEMSFD